jgi:ABC-type polysaccharide/polyol phosphate transport system ATPase subunit
MAKAPPIHIADLTKKYVVWHSRPVSFKDAIVQRLTHAAVDKEQFWALKGVSFDVHPGEAVGIIGPNGSGKSTLLGILGRVLRPTAGVADIRGRISILMEAGVGFHEDMTGIENIYLSGAMLGMRRKEIAQRIDEIIDFAGIQDFIDSPVRMLSSGMYMRLGFSVAIHLDPDILLVDEVLAVGDESFHHKVRTRLSQFRNNGGAVVFVSHRMAEVRWLCDRVIWIQKGLVQAEGPTEQVIDSYISAHAPGEVDLGEDCLLPE